LGLNPKQIALLCGLIQETLGAAWNLYYCTYITAPFFPLPTLAHVIAICADVPHLEGITNIAA
jgi:hypothetical protein